MGRQGQEERKCLACLFSCLLCCVCCWQCCLAHRVAVAKLLWQMLLLFCFCAESVYISISICVCACSLSSAECRRFFHLQHAKEIPMAFDFERKQSPLARCLDDPWQNFCRQLNYRAALRHGLWRRRRNVFGDDMFSAAGLSFSFALWGILWKVALNFVKGENSSPSNPSFLRKCFSRFSPSFPSSFSVIFFNIRNCSILCNIFYCFGQQ